MPGKHGETGFDTSFQAYAWMLSGAFSFALMGTMAHGAAENCDWQLLTIARTSGALLLSGILSTVAGVQLLFWPPKTLWVRSIAGSISLVCTFYPLTRLPVADVLTLTNMFPIWVALLSWPVLGALPTMEVWLAVASGITGVFLMLQPHGGEGNFAAFVALFASFTTAISMMGLHRLRHIDSRAIVFHFSAVAMVFCISSLFLFERHVPSARLTYGWTPWLLVGVGMMAASGQIFLTKAFANGHPAKVSVVGLMQIPFAMVLDIVLWNRSFAPITLVGMLFIVAPTARLLSARR